MSIIPLAIGGALRNFFRMTSTVPYPKRRAAPPERFRGFIEISESCIACGACRKACPAKCIALERTRISYWMDKCIFCGRCVEVCPVGAVKFTKSYVDAREGKDFYSVRAFEMAKCLVCGKETVPLAQKKYLVEVKKENPESLGRCDDCRMKPVPAPEKKQPETQGSENEAARPGNPPGPTATEGPPWVNRK